MMRYLAGILLLLTALTGCGGSGSSSSGGPGDVPGDNGGGDQEPVVGRTFVIEPGESATNDMVTAMIAARPVTLSNLANVTLSCAQDCRFPPRKIFTSKARG